MLEKKASGAICFRNEPDEAAIQDLCSRSATVISYSVSESFLYTLLILRVLNRFGLPELRIVEAEEISLEHVPLWREIEAQLTIA